MSLREPIDDGRLDPQRLDRLVIAAPHRQAAWLDDADAMAAVTAGDQNALRHLYERHGRLARECLPLLVTDEAAING